MIAGDAFDKTIILSTGKCIMEDSKSGEKRCYTPFPMDRLTRIELNELLAKSRIEEVPKK